MWLRFGDGHNSMIHKWAKKPKYPNLHTGIQSDILYNIADSLRQVTNGYNAHTKYM